MTENTPTEHYRAADFVALQLGLLQERRGPIAVAFICYVLSDILLDVAAPAVAPSLGLLLVLAKYATALTISFLLLRELLDGIAGEGGSALVFVGTTLLAAFVTGIGLLLLVVPGLYIILRWLPAVPAALSSGEIVESLQRAWDATRAHQAALIGAGLPIVAVFLLSGFIGIDNMAIPFPFARAIVASIIATGAQVWLTLLEVAAFFLLMADYPAARYEPA